MTTRTKLKPRSERDGRRGVAAWRRQEADAVHARVRCEVGPCREGGTGGAHHPFGRHDEPWSSSRLVQVLLCRKHHENVTGRVGFGTDLELRDALRWLAFERTHLHVNSELRKLGRPRVAMGDVVGDAPMMFKLLIEVADLNGIEPPYFGSERRRT